MAFRTLILSGVAAIAFAGAAHADNNLAFIDQINTAAGTYAEIGQIGNSNLGQIDQTLSPAAAVTAEAVLKQDGDDNYGFVNQYSSRTSDGFVGSAAVTQDGNLNSAEVTQRGSRSGATVVQDGNSNSASSDQSATSAHLRIDQTGDFNLANVRQFAGAGSWAHVMQDGDFNVGLIMQDTGKGQIAEISTIGNGTTAVISQR